VSNRRVVYSTDQGRHCPSCNKPVTQCKCTKRNAKSPRNAQSAATTAAVPADGIVRLSRQTKGRGGKPVTLISGIDADAPTLKALAKELKNKCGSGGSIEPGNIILIQGDKRDSLKPLLEAKGYTVKLAGG